VPFTILSVLIALTSPTPSAPIYTLLAATLPSTSAADLITPYFSAVARGISTALFVISSARPLILTASRTLTCAPFSTPRLGVPSVTVPVTIPTIRSARPVTLSAEIVPEIPTEPSASITSYCNLNFSSGVKRPAVPPVK
jgi:hypothetical protein